jgi:hypothetical protein
LHAALKARHVFGGQCAVFGYPAMHPRAPFAPVVGVQLAFHEGLYIVFAQSELCINGIEGRTVFPGHFDNAVDVLNAKHKSETQKREYCSEFPRCIKDCLAARLVACSFWALFRAFRCKSSFGSAMLCLIAGFPLQSLARQDRYLSIRLRVIATQLAFANALLALKTNHPLKQLANYKLRCNRNSMRQKALLLTSDLHPSVF